MAWHVASDCIMEQTEGSSQWYLLVSQCSHQIHPSQVMEQTQTMNAWWSNENRDSHLTRVKKECCKPKSRKPLSTSSSPVLVSFTTQNVVPMPAAWVNVWEMQNPWSHPDLLNLHFDKIAKWSVCILKFEEHYFHVCVCVCVYKYMATTSCKMILSS